MTIPTISVEVLNRVKTESGHDDANEDIALRFMGDLFKRLESQNPAIADFLFNVTEKFKDTRWISPGMLYALMVYRILELTLPEMPMVSKEVGAPIQEYLLRDPGRHIEQTANRLKTENLLILSAGGALVAGLYLTGAEEEAWMATAVGLCTYLLLEGQIEADALASCF